MDRVFDILLYLDLFIAVPVFVLELIRFPAWVERIDLNKNIEGKPIGRYLENRFVLVELRIVLTVVAFAAGSIVFMLLGSFPREIGSPKFLLFLPILLMVAGTGIGGVFLGNWFYKTAKRSEIFREAQPFPIGDGDLHLFLFEHCRGIPDDAPVFSFELDLTHRERTCGRGVQRRSAKSATRAQQAGHVHIKSTKNRKGRGR